MLKPAQPKQKQRMLQGICRRKAEVNAIAEAYADGKAGGTRRIDECKLAWLKPCRCTRCTIKNSTRSLDGKISAAE